MATTPQRPPVPPPAPAGNHPAVIPKPGEHGGARAEGYRPTIGVKGEEIEDGERDPDTIAEEQRARSDEMEKTGMAKWIAEHDERKGEHSEALKVAAQKRVENHKAP